MQKYVKIYLDYFDIGEQDLITCECCGRQGRADGSGFDIHHINGRGPGKDVIENLMAVCRKCHDKAKAEIMLRSDFQLIHNYFLSGQRKVFFK